jgi:hypothetical protein
MAAQAVTPMPATLRLRAPVLRSRASSRMAATGATWAALRAGNKAEAVLDMVDGSGGERPEGVDGPHAPGAFLEEPASGWSVEDGRQEETEPTVAGGEGFLRLARQIDR